MTSTDAHRPTPSPEATHPYPQRHPACKAFAVLRYTLVSVIAAMLGVPALLGWFAGWQLIEVAGGSMAPTYAWGDVIVVDTRDHEQLTTGSIVTARRSDGVIYTHRILTVSSDGSATTQGDANPIPDPEPITRDNIIGHVIGHISAPWAHIVTVSQSLLGRISLTLLLTGLILLPALTRKTPATQESRTLAEGGAER